MRARARAYCHTQTHVHTRALKQTPNAQEHYTQFATLTLASYKQGLKRRRTATARVETRQRAGLLSWEEKCFEAGLEGVWRGLLSERKGKAIPCGVAV